VDGDIRGEGDTKVRVYFNCHISKGTEKILKLPDKRQEGRDFMY
jgi:hypothetical protein